MSGNTTMLLRPVSVPAARVSPISERSLVGAPNGSRHTTECLLRLTLGPATTSGRRGAALGRAPGPFPRNSQVSPSTAASYREHRATLRSARVAQLALTPRSAPGVARIAPERRAALREERRREAGELKALVDHVLVQSWKGGVPSVVADECHFQ